MFNINLETSSLKSNCVSFPLRNLDYLINPVIMMSEYILDYIHSTKYLKIRLDRRLVWNVHIIFASGKVNLASGFDILSSILPKSGTDDGVL